MTTETTKQSFLDLLQANISDEQVRKQLLEMANDLIVNDALRADLAALGSRQMGLVYGAYKRYNPEHPHDQRPALDQVLAWLMLSSGLPYITNLEERLSELHRLSMSTGLLDLDEAVIVSAATVLEMRVVSYVDPASRPARLRKKKKLIKREVEK